MAETVENVNKSEFFQNIVKDYENTPIAEYFKNDVEEILKLAKNGLTLTDEAELNSVYNATMTLVEGLNKKIDACLNEIVLNFKGKGGNSNLKGTFYHRSDAGSSKETAITQAAKAAIETKDFTEKSTLFLTTLGTFKEYVNNSSLKTSIETAASLTIDDAGKSLKVVYENSLRVEKMWGYREEGSELKELIENDNQIRTELAVPFRYYTIVAGLKTGAIKSLTPEMINDLKWIEASTRDTKTILPEGVAQIIKNPNFKNDKEAKDKVMKILIDSYTDQKVKDELITARTNFSFNAGVMAASLEKTGTFRRGSFTIPRGLITWGACALGATLLLTGLSAPSMAGYQGNFIELLGETIVGSLGVNLVLPIAIAAVPGAIITKHYTSKTKEFVGRYYKNLSQEERKQLILEIQKLKTIQDTKDFEKKVVEINKKYKNVFGEKTKEIAENANIVRNSIVELENLMNKKILQPVNTKRGNEDTKVHYVEYKDKILEFAAKLNLSQDSPFFEVVNSVLGLVEGYTPKVTPSLATGTVHEETNVTRAVTVETPNVNSTSVVENGNTEIIPTQPTNAQTSKAYDQVITKIKKNINKLAHKFAVTTEQSEFIIDMQIQGEIEKIHNFDGRLNEIMSEINELMQDENSLETTFIIKNDAKQAARMTKKGIVGLASSAKSKITRKPNDRAVKPGQDSLTIKVERRKK